MSRDEERWERHLATKEALSRSPDVWMPADVDRDGTHVVEHFPADAQVSITGHLTPSDPGTGGTE